MVTVFNTFAKTFPDLSIKKKKKKKKKKMRNRIFDGTKSRKLIKDENYSGSVKLGKLRGCNWT